MQSDFGGPAHLLLMLITQSSCSNFKPSVPLKWHNLMFGHSFFFPTRFMLLLILSIFVSICAAPSQQPTPVGFASSYSSIQLSWHPPDSPNSNRLNYTLFRDGQSVRSIQSHYPFSKHTHKFSNNVGSPSYYFKHIKHCFPFIVSLQTHFLPYSLFLPPFLRPWIFWRHRFVSLHQLLLLAYNS